MASYSGEPGLLPCRSCDMVFRSWALLSDHTQRFCIGLTPDVTVGAKPSAELGGVTAVSQELQGCSDQEANRPALERLREEVLTDPAFETSPLIHVDYTRERLPTPNDHRSLFPQVQCLRLSLQEMQPYVINSPLWEAAGSPCKRLQALYATHARRKAQTEAWGRTLEQRSAELNGYLQGLTQAPGRIPRLLGLEQELRELRAEAGRTRGALEVLSTHVQELKPQIRNRPDTEFCWPMLQASTGSLAAEIGAFCEAYKQGGGRDPGIMSKIWQLQAEASALELRRSLNRREKASATSGQLLELETENQRLEAEILALQMQRGLDQLPSGPMVPRLQKRGVPLLPPVAPLLPPLPVSTNFQLLDSVEKVVRTLVALGGLSASALLYGGSMCH